MGKVDKKRRKLQERINILQEELSIALTKKSSNTPELNIGLIQRRIMELRKELETL